MDHDVKIPPCIKEFCSYLRIPNDKIIHLLKLQCEMIQSYSDIARDIELRSQSSTEESIEIPDRFEGLLSAFQDLNQMMTDFHSKHFNEIKENDLMDLCDCTKDIFTEIIHLEADRTIKPEVKTTVKPEVKTTVKPEVKTTVKPEVKTTIKPEVKTTIKPEVKTTVKPEVKTTVKPARSQIKVNSRINKNLIPIPVVKATTKHYDKIWGEDEEEDTM